MQLLKSKSVKKELKQFISENPFESIGGIGKGVIGALKEDLVKKGVYEAKDEIAGLKETHGGDLSQGNELDLSEIKHAVHEITEMGHEYVREIVHAGRIANAENSQEIQVKMQEILIEIKQLANSSELLKKQVEVVTVEQATQKPGKYHVNFLEQMLSFIRDARMNVENSLAWFSALRSKKAARQYGAMTKKHGTGFTLSNERNAATQVG